MDKESLIRLGLGNIKNVDLTESHESYDLDTNNHIIYLKLIKDLNMPCPCCGVIGQYRLRSTITQKINHSSLLENNITIVLHRRIWKCECCNKTFKEPNPFKLEKDKNTKEKQFKILQSLSNINNSFSSVANEFNVSITTVINIFDKHINMKRETLTEVICVDEVYSKHCGYHKYCFILYSPQTDKILDVLPSRNKEDLCSYFGKIPLNERKKVKYFSMDLYDVYRQVAKICFPNALICADHFHVIKNLTDNFNTARIRIMKKYEYLKNQNDNWYWLYKKYWKKLLRDPSTLGYKKYKTSKSGCYLNDHEVVTYMLSIDKDLEEAYNLLNEYRVFNSIATTKNAAEMLDDLIIKFGKSKLAENHKSYKLLKNWRFEIINSFTRIDGCVISNGGIERANRDVKTIIRLAYGFTNFNRLRNRIMYVKNNKHK